MKMKAAGAPARSKLRWERVIFWAFAAVVAFFLTDTIVSQRLASAIDDGAGRIAGDYAPSVVALALARSEMHRLQDFVSNYVDSGGQATDRFRVVMAQAEFNRAAAAYESLPFEPGERELWARVRRDVDGVHAIVDRIVRAVGHGDTAEARRMVNVDLVAAVDKASTDILANIELNGGASDDAARMIARRRQASLRAAILLDAATVAITIAIALLVYRLFAQHDALQREHARTLQEANLELELFANRLSHDIVSPLASTRLALDSALNSCSDEGASRMLRRGQQGLERATRIAHALLEFARAGARPAPGERADVRSVVAGVVDELQPLADERGARLETSLPTQAWVSCAEGLLTSAVSNLVRNAITYLDGGAAKRVDILAVDAGERVRLEVRDTGPGLPPGVEATVFEPYVRGPGTTQPGLGLGLATVKRIAETHGGRVGVDSRPGAGARFWIELPKTSGP
jgi:signal transduction histidine kinase